MSDWNPELYLKFNKERTQPVYDLISRIKIDNPKRIIDIGCGPGNSTAVLKEKWSDAEIIGIDYSQTMINKAKKDYPEIKFIVGDAAEDLSKLGSFDIVFANASLHWITDHKSLIPRLLDLTCKNGAFATQIPQFDNMPISEIIKDTANSLKWQKYFTEFKTGYVFYPDECYYDYLNGKSNNIYMWATKYYHIMDSHNSILDMIKSTGLKPYLDNLPAELHSEFLDDILDETKEAYSLQPDKKVLFPFERFFIIAYNN